MNRYAPLAIPRLFIGCFSKLKWKNDSTVTEKRLSGLATYGRNFC